jgi:rRNA maturation protein Nop10
MPIATCPNCGGETWYDEPGCRRPGQYTLPCALCGRVLSVP